MSIETEDIGAVLADICEAAAQAILPLWRSGLTVDRKADESPVTEADRRGEALILAALAERWPHIPVVSEEDASEFGAPEAIGPRFFLVDPLDGTKAFVRGDPSFTVNIGLVVNGAAVAGAVCAPPSGETWFTGLGGCRKRRLGEQDVGVRVRPWPRGAAVALVSHTLGAAALQVLRAQYGFDVAEAMDSSIKLCRVAEGVADLYPRLGPTMEWDTAAGHAVLTAAGGVLTQADGAAFIYGKADQGFRNGDFVARGG